MSKHATERIAFRLTPWYIQRCLQPRRVSPVTPDWPSLKFLHDKPSMVQLKLDKFRSLSSEELIGSLTPGRDGCLKTRANGTVLDGHHRLFVLRERGEDIDRLPRELVLKQNDPD